MRLIVLLVSKVPPIFGTTFEDLVNKLDKLSEEDVGLMIRNRAVYLVTLAPWDCLWIPAGSAMLEETSIGHLNFGCKIPIIQQTPQFLKNYSHYATLCGPGQQKMKEVAAFLSEQIASTQLQQVGGGQAGGH